MQQPIILFDFDGTVCLGHGPLKAYAREAFSHLPTTAPTTVSTQGSILTQPAAWATLEDFLASADQGVQGAPVQDMQVWAVGDGYELVKQLAETTATPAQLDAAYLASRAQLPTPECEIYPAPGIGELLDQLNGQARCVLATNSPALGLHPALERLGVADKFAAVIHSAGKPTKLPALINSLLGDAPADSLLSIGDHWVNDIAPARELGCTTAFVSAYPAPAHPADFRAPSLRQLIPEILAWVKQRR